MFDLYLTFKDIKDLEKLENNVDSNYYLHYFNSLKKNDKNKSFKLKNEWSARLDPFILIKKDEKVIKCFYSETGENAVDQFINYLNIK